MFKNGKGEVLLQYLRISIILFLILIFTSCVTDEQAKSLKLSDVKLFFNGSVEDEWLKGLGYIKKNSEQGHLNILLSLYLDDKYKSIQDAIRLLIIDFFNRDDYDISILLNFVKTSSDSESICLLINNFNIDEVLSFVQVVYKSEIDMRSQLIEDIGRYNLDFQNVLYLYSLDDIDIKLGVLSSSGFINHEEIYDWLVDRLYENDEALSSAAVFTLSKHGTRGFSYLAKNLAFISNRLKLVTIDLLSFNKVEEAYGYYARLLVNPSQLVTERVIRSYKTLGLKGVKYILDALEISSYGVKLQLLELLEEIPGADYLSRISFLLEYPDTQEYIIDLYFRQNAVGFIKDLLLKGDYSVQDKVIEYGVQNRSNILIKDTSLEYFSLRYFLENYEQEIILEYLRDIDTEDNYIEDYEFLVEINTSLKFIDDFGKLNGEIEYITKYFELEQKKSISQQESKLFYKNMESWLETGDNDFLNSSLSLKNADNPNISGVENEKILFLDQLDANDALEIMKYEDSIKKIKVDYRKLTFRLKEFAHLFISQKGYYYLIE